MKIILSPAKSINEGVDCSQASTSQPLFGEEAENLVSKLSKLSARQIKNLMGVSADLAELNFERFQNWNKNIVNTKPAAYLFSGAAYQGLDFTSLNQNEQAIGQDKLRILSGLYGVLKPLDLIQPYRLEMGTSFKVTAKITNLYKFWGDKIRKAIEEDMKLTGANILVNAASSEYFKAAQLDKMNCKIITTVFKDKAKDGTYKMNMQFAKLSRGAMARFVIENKLAKSEDLKAFNTGGYTFSSKESSASEFVYLR